MTQMLVAAAALLLAPAAAETPVMATMPRIVAGQITSDDYPPAALRNEAEGRTSAGLVIDPHGRVRRCRIAQSSGHEILDSRVCQLALVRMRFSPALDATGQPMTVQVVLPVVWKIEEPAPPAPAP